ncbi:NAD(P)-binding domain-containing protein [Halotia wernerae UHCC 0503]|nr:NAD(P)-binding domain-containing protein [Halotia wernerae UHCC 0503]
MQLSPGYQESFSGLIESFATLPSSKTCRVAIIGGGASGITSAKCLREDGHEPVIFESTDQIGGVWVYRKEVSSTFSTVHLQNSKYVSGFSDYPMPNHFSEFPHHSEVLEYLNNYVHHFKLRDCIRLNTRVNKVKRVGDFWEVTTCSPDGKSTEIFDAIAICCGIYHEPKIPNFPGQEKFKGQIIHSKFYKEPSIFLGKKVVVLGNGPSGVDIAVVASYTADSVVWGFRKKRWMLPRYASGQPIDFNISRLNKLMPSKLLSLILGLKLYSVYLEHKKCNILPAFNVEKSVPIMNDNILNRVRIGAIKTKPGISGFEENRVLFEDGTSVEADIVVYATGFQLNLPFLQDFLDDKNPEGLNFYKNVFHPELPQLAFIGFVYGNFIFPCSELQARWFSKVLSKEVSLPSEEQMTAAIQAESDKREKELVPSGYRHLRVPAFDYMDDIANQINARPQIWRNFKIAWELLAGPLVSTQYRLNGPNQWEGSVKWISSLSKLARRQLR